MVAVLKAIFAKTGDMRFISHLDLMRLFQRAVRRAGLGVAMTQGFSPHLRISVTRALKLGVESRSEEAVFRMDKVVDPDVFVREMNAFLPEGVSLSEADYV
jgi:radical SAM-linked protein